MPHQHDQHLTTEELSALLDEQLSDQERTAFAEHLTTCQQCRGMLSDLRQTVALLHALPTPTLPRSFALPLQTKFTPADEPMPLHTPITQLATRRNQKRSRLPLVVRTFSTIAAVIGLAFLLTGVFHSVSLGGSALSTTSNSTAGSGPQAANTQATASSLPKGVSPRTSTDTATPTIHKTPVIQPTPVPATPSQSQPGLPAVIDPTLTIGQLGIGILFLVLAAAGLLTLSLTGKKSRAP